eukprot:609884-Pelagomonas_calceolata.AAC.3
MYRGMNILRHPSLAGSKMLAQRIRSKGRPEVSTCQQGKREEQCGAAGRPLHHAHVLRLQMKMASAYPAHFHRHLHHSSYTRSIVLERCLAGLSTYHTANSASTRGLSTSFLATFFEMVHRLVQRLVTEMATNGNSVHP